MDCTNLHFIVTENPLLREASPEQKLDWGIIATCKIITPSALLEKDNVKATLSVFDDVALTDEQKVFLYLNHHRWKQLSVEELREHVGDAPLELLKALDHDKWEMVQKVKNHAAGVLEKVEGVIPEEIVQAFGQSTSFSKIKSEQLVQALGQSTSFSTIKNISLWSTLAQTAKPDHTIPGNTVSKK